MVDKMFEGRGDVIATDSFSLVDSCLDEIRPAMAADGGGVKLRELKGGTVYVEMLGTCLDCPSVDLTMEHGITRTLKSRMPWIDKVERITTTGVFGNE